MIRSIMFAAAVIASMPAQAGQVPTVAASAVVNPPVSASSAIQSPEQKASQDLAISFNDANHDLALSAGIQSMDFNRPVQIRQTVFDPSLNAEILNLAKIIQGKVQFYGGRYDWASPDTMGSRNSF